MDDYDGDYEYDKDTRNVKAQARTRKMRIGTVTKSYNYKAMKKIKYSKEDRGKKSYDAYKADEDEKERIKEEVKWTDSVTDKHTKKIKEKQEKMEEKTRKKLEKLELYKSEMKNGRKKK